ncbi:MAG TPA: hypothetical protein VHF22_15265 [Planctomycetota bacterium]|nr:hypothetical protein [Planctomycetota bacterium]
MSWVNGGLLDSLWSSSGVVAIGEGKTTELLRVGDGRGEARVAAQVKLRALGSFAPGLTFDDLGALLLVCATEMPEGGDLVVVAPCDVFLGSAPLRGFPAAAPLLEAARSRAMRTSIIEVGNRTGSAAFEEFCKATGGRHAVLPADARLVKALEAVMVEIGTQRRE